MSPPSSEVIKAFGLEGEPKRIDEGRGLCYLVDQAILRPSEDDVEDQWISELTASLLQNRRTSYRLATPLPTISPPGAFVFKGWTASSFLSGTAAPKGRFIDKVKTSRAFHADLAQVVHEKPATIEKRVNRWTKADSVAWGEARLGEIEGVNETLLAQLKSLLDRLAHVWRQLPEGLPWQLVHGDLTGNILFADDAETPPAIIDYTFYWRPAEYANAVIVADGLAWAGEGRELLEFYATGDIRVQLLVRAMYWRILTFAIDSDLGWVQENLPKTDYAGAVELLYRFAAGQGD